MSYYIYKNITGGYKYEKVTISFTWIDYDLAWYFYLAGARL